MWLSGERTSVRQQLREYGPVLLVPAAWTAAAAAEFGVMSADGILIAHGVMAAFIAFFLVTGWEALDTGALRAWRVVLVVGFGITLAGLAGFFVPSAERLLWTSSFVGWMVLPAGALAYTGWELPDAEVVYYGGAALSLVGAAIFVATLLTLDERFAVVGLAMVGAGQTAGIVDAAVWR